MHEENKKTLGYLNTVGGLIAWVFIIVLGSWIFGFNFGYIEDGTTNPSYSSSGGLNSCKQVINLNQGDWATYWHPFVCSYGQCIAMNFDSNGICIKGYVYSAKTTINAY